MDKNNVPSLGERLAALQAQVAHDNQPDLRAQLELAEQRLALVEQAYQNILAAFPVPAALPDLPLATSGQEPSAEQARQHVMQYLPGFDEGAYLTLNAESLQHSRDSCYQHFLSMSPMSVRWMQVGQKPISLDSAAHLLVVCCLDPHEADQIQALHQLLLDLQYCYDITVLQLGRAVLDWPEFDRVYTYAVRDHYGELQYTIQYLCQRYPALQHSLIFGARAKNAYWSLALAGLPRTAVWWQELDGTVTQPVMLEMMFWADKGVAQPALHPYLATRFSAKSLNAWRFIDWRQLTRQDWIQLLEQAQAQHQRLVESQAQIRASKLFLSSFFSPAYNEQIGQAQYIEQYLRHWYADIEPRKPFPGFHPGIYAEQNQLPFDTEPLGHYLTHQLPSGPWRQRVVKSAAVQLAPDAPVALHIHAYYVDMLPQLVERIEANRLRPDLFVSVRDATDAATAKQILCAYPAKVTIRTVPNRGRDIGPFLTEFGAELVQAYRYIGHIHTKQSLHVVERDAVTAWQSFLLEAMMGSEHSGNMMDACVSHLVLHSDTSIIYPDDPKVLGWDGNRPFAQLLAEAMQLGPLPDAFNFPAGTMFWLRNDLLRHFVDLGLQWEDYPQEPVGKDGTMLHALERLFGAVPLLLNQAYSVAWAPGFSR